MLNHININNFKSIKNISFDCNRVNLFIGKPSTGKSNILEALGLLSWTAYNSSLNFYVRYRDLYNLFFNQDIDIPIMIYTKIDNNSQTIKIRYQDDRIKFSFLDGLKENQFADIAITKHNISIDDISYTYKKLDMFNSIKYYKYVSNAVFPDIIGNFLKPPIGQNLVKLLEKNEKIRDISKQLFKSTGYALRLKPREHTFTLVKEIGDVDIDFPVEILSDTLRRILFYYTAIYTNKDSTLIFEEPESHAFPYYTKQLGEKIGYDNSNQYFIATHNPYLLKSILSKTEKTKANVFITYFKNYETKVYKLKNHQIPLLLDTDPFFDAETFIEE